MPTPESTRGQLWRVFPWQAGAPAGARFSSSYVPPPTGRGRFDLPRAVSSVLYTSEDAEHAVGEMFQPWRSRRLESFHLKRAGFPLALVEVRVASASMERIADLCDPAHLAAGDIAPDRSASRFRHLTQPIARTAWDTGFHGLRWWSSFWGDWHTVVLFTDRTKGHVRFGAPEVLTLDHTAVRGAAELLGMQR